MQRDKASSGLPRVSHILLPPNLPEVRHPKKEAKGMESWSRVQLWPVTAAVGKEEVRGRPREWGCNVALDAALLQVGSVGQEQRSRNAQPMVKDREPSEFQQRQQTCLSSHCVLTEWPLPATGVLLGRRGFPQSRLACPAVSYSFIHAEFQTRDLPAQQKLVSL